MKRAGGVTLVELITVIVIVGVVAAITAVFITPSLRGYVDSERRARLTDIADGALRRMARDIQSALPNSIRVENNQLDLILVDAAGRYSHDQATNNNCFVAGVGCSVIQTVGSVITANNQYLGRGLVIYNISNNLSGNCAANDPNNPPSVWCGHNISWVSGSTDGGAIDTFSFANKSFLPGSGSPRRRFYLVGPAVAYQCHNATAIGGNGVGELRRYEGCRLLNKTGDNIVSLCTGATARVLAHRLSSCQITYTSGPTQQKGLVILELELMEANERVRLYHEVHVDNIP